MPQNADSKRQLEKAVNLIFNKKVEQLKTQEHARKIAFFEQEAKKYQNRPDIKKANTLLNQVRTICEKLNAAGIPLSGTPSNTIRISNYTDARLYYGANSVANAFHAAWQKKAVDFEALELKRIELIANLYGNDADFQALCKQIDALFAKFKA